MAPGTGKFSEAIDWAYDGGTTDVKLKVNAIKADKRRYVNGADFFLIIGGITKNPPWFQGG
jgi:hypothetical protein